MVWRQKSRTEREVLERLRAKNIGQWARFQAEKLAAEGRYVELGKLAQQNFKQGEENKDQIAYRKAIVFFETLREKQNFGGEDLRKLIRAYDAVGEDSKVTQILTKEIEALLENGLVGDAASLYSELQALGVNAYLDGERTGHSKHYKKAVTYLEKLKELNDEHFNNGKKSLPVLAWTHYALGDKDKSAETFNDLGDRLLEDDPVQAARAYIRAYKITKDPKYLLYVGQAHEENGNLEGAETLYKYLVSKDVAEGWFGLGNIYDEQGKYEKAEEAYFNFLMSKPDDYDALYNLIGTEVKLIEQTKGANEKANRCETTISLIDKILPQAPEEDREELKTAKEALESFLKKDSH